MDKISALMDGELDAHHAELAVARLKQDPAARESWETFHLIGDALRGECMVTTNPGRRLSDRLAQEPTVLAPRPKPASRVTTYAYSVAASLSAVALVGWVAFHNPLGPRPEVVATAATAVPAPAASPAPALFVQLASVPSDGKTNDYLIVHQEFSGSTAFQGLAPYIRTVPVIPTNE